MAAPLVRLLKAGGYLRTTANFIKCGIKHQPLLQHRAYSVCTHHSRISVDSLAQRLSRQCMIANHPFSSLTPQPATNSAVPVNICNYPQSSQLLQSPVRFVVQPTRSIKRYSLGKGKKKTVKAVVSRFYRLNSGLWLRTRAGRNRAMWKKSSQRRKRLKQFVFCSHNQSKKLDLMVTAYWRRQKNIPDDPFAPFENRNWFGYKDYPGGHYVKSMEKKGMPINMPYKKDKF